MRGWRILVVLVLCFVLTGSIACIPGDSEEVSQQLVEVTRGDLTITVSGSGNIDISNERNLAFSSGGKIDKIYVNEGDKVSKGNMLVKLDTSTLELALIQTKAGLVQARVAHDEMEYNLNQLRDVLHASSERVKLAESAVAAAKEQVEAAERAVAEAQKALDEASITAPFDGVVAAIFVDEGDIVAPAIPVVHFADLSSLELIAEIDEIDIAEVKLDQKTIIEVDALPTLELEGKIKSISQLPKVAAGVVLYEVKIGFEVPSNFELKAGMSASVDIIINEKNNILLVPDRAITKDSQGNPVVKIKVNEEIEERPVTTGISDGLQTEILEGLNEGEVVVVERRGG